MKLSDVVSSTIKGFWGTEATSEADGIPVIKTNNMTYEGAIDYTDICYRNISIASINDNFLKKGDLLIEKSGGTKTHSVGYVNYFDEEDSKYVCNNFIMGLRMNSKLVFSKYIFYQLQYLYCAGRFSDCYNKTTGIQNLQVSSYLNKEIKVPEKAQQLKVIGILDKIVGGIAACKEKIKLMDELVKSRFITQEVV